MRGSSWLGLNCQLLHTDTCCTWAGTLACLSRLSRCKPNSRAAVVPTAPTQSARLPAAGVAIHAQNRSQSHSNSGVVIHAKNRSQSHSTLVNGRGFADIHCFIAGLGVSGDLGARPSLPHQFDGASLARKTAIRTRRHCHTKSPALRQDSSTTSPKAPASLWMSVLRFSTDISATADVEGMPPREPEFTAEREGKDLRWTTN
jgi:hypothetical protein